MGIKHFSGLFVMLCVGFGLSILTTIGEHIVYRLVLPRIKKKSKMKYWLHTSQVRVLEGPCESCVADWESLDKNKVWNVVRALTIGIWRVTAASGAWRGWPKDGMGSTEETVQILKAHRGTFPFALVASQLSSFGWQKQQCCYPELANQNILSHCYRFPNLWGMQEVLSNFPHCSREINGTELLSVFALKEEVTLQQKTQKGRTSVALKQHSGRNLFKWILTPGIVSQLFINISVCPSLGNWGKINLL